ncbi:MAG: hypothetical protein AB7F50_00685 [Fimbriimonadaceae bacterium]
MTDQVLGLERAAATGHVAVVACHIRRQCHLARAHCARRQVLVHARDEVPLLDAQAERADGDRVLAEAGRLCAGRITTVADDPNDEVAG